MGRACVVRSFQLPGLLCQRMLMSISLHLRYIDVACWRVRVRARARRRVVACFRWMCAKFPELYSGRAWRFNLLPAYTPVDPQGGGRARQDEGSLVVNLILEVYVPEDIQCKKQNKKTPTSVTVSRFLHVTQSVPGSGR